MKRTTIKQLQVKSAFYRADIPEVPAPVFGQLAARHHARRAIRTYGTAWLKAVG